MSEHLETEAFKKNLSDIHNLFVNGTNNLAIFNSLKPELYIAHRRQEENLPPQQVENSQGMNDSETGSTTGGIEELNLNGNEGAQDLFPVLPDEPNGDKCTLCLITLDNDMELYSSPCNHMFH